MECKLKNSVKYRDLKKVSTLPEYALDAQCSVFYNQHGRLPEYDEVTGSNSSGFLNEELHINKFNGVENQRLLQFTGKETVQEAVIDINNTYTDQQMEVLDLGESSIVKTFQRPDTKPKEITTRFEPNEEVSSTFIIQGLNTLRNQFGYDFKEVTNYDLNQEEWNHLMPKNKLVKAFIYDGNIYINVDRATPDSKVHEMLHLLVGTLRFSNPELYTSLLAQVEVLPNINILLDQHRDKTRNDALEEVFVTELSKNLVGVKSALDSMTKEERYEVQRNIKRTLDTLLLGDYSTKIISDDRLARMSIKEIAQEVNSDKLTNTFTGTYNIPGSDIHRQLANQKSDLLRKGDLVEICN